MRRPTQPLAGPRRSAAPRLSLAIVMALGLALIALVTTGAAQPPSEPSPTPAETAPPAPAGRQTDVVAELTGNQRGQIRLALPELEGSSRLVGGGATAASELDQVLRADLADSGVFEIQGPSALRVVALTGDKSRDYEQYRSLGNEMLLACKVFRQGERLVFEGRLIDLAGGDSILGKRYRGSFASARRIAHTFADEVVRFLTGRPGLGLTRIAFVSDRAEQGRKEIYFMDWDGANLRRMTAHRSTSLSPAWTADGSGFAYTSFVGGSPGVYWADAKTGAKQALVTDGSFNISPTLSPDGKKIAFARSLSGNIDIFVADRSGAQRSRLTNSRAIDTNPAWSPQGGTIAFTSSRSGSPQIYAMDPEGANVRRISFQGSYNDNAAWSADGTRIAYSSRQKGRFQIAVTDVVTLETRLLTSGPGSHEDPTFSPDGRRIAFVLKRGGARQIWVIDSETGGGLRQLTRIGNNESPSWSPYLQ